MTQNDFRSFGGVAATPVGLPDPVAEFPPRVRSGQPQPDHANQKIPRAQHDGEGNLPPFLLAFSLRLDPLLRHAFFVRVRDQERGRGHGAVPGQTPNPGRVGEARRAQQQSPGF
jgi:hypothetical protein